MTPVSKTDSWQFALFMELTMMFDNAGEAHVYFMYVYDKDIFFFESSEKRFGIKASELTPSLLREVFELNDWIKQDIKRRKDNENIHL